MTITLYGWESASPDWKLGGPDDIQAGALIVITAGEYSDYQMMDVFRALKTFSPRSVVQAFLREHPAEAQEYRGNFDRCVSWMQRGGYIAPEMAHEVRLGAYGTYDVALAGDLIRSAERTIPTGPTYATGSRGAK